MIPEDIVREASDIPQCRSSFEQLAERLPADTAVIDRALDLATEALDGRAVTALFVAAVHAGHTLDARHLVHTAPLFWDMTLYCSVALHCAGDVGGALCEALVQRRMERLREPYVAFTAAYWHVKIEEQPVPDKLIVQVRNTARSHVQGVGQLALAGVDALLAMAKQPAAIIPDIFDESEAIPLVEALAAKVALPPMQNVPEQEPTDDTVTGSIRRAVPRIGRNEPCPCGSGKKYKRCCYDKDQQRLRRSSDVAGLTVDELRRDIEPHLTLERLNRLAAHEAARLDHTKVPDEVLRPLVEHLILHRHIGRALDILERDPRLRDSAINLELALEVSLRSGRADLVARTLELARQWGIDMGDSIDVRLFQAAESERVLLDELERQAAADVAGNEYGRLADMAYALLIAKCPALAILVARSLVPLADPLDMEFLSDTIGQARDSLSLYDADPFRAVVEQRFDEGDWDWDWEDHKDNEATEHTDHLRSQLEAKQSELEFLRHELADLQKAQQQHIETHTEPAAQPLSSRADEAERGHADEEQVAKLRSRVEYLKGLLKERHQERSELRSALAEARAQAATQPREPAHGEPAADTEDALFSEDIEDSTQGIRLPCYASSFEDDIEKVPVQVAKRAMEAVGRLAAGSAAAFRGTRRLVSNREVLRQRIGISHRLLFRLQEHRIELLRLVPRQGLETAVKLLK